MQAISAGTGDSLAWQRCPPLVLILPLLFVLGPMSSSGIDVAVPQREGEENQGAAMACTFTTWPVDEAGAAASSTPSQSPARHAGLPPWHPGSAMAPGAATGRRSCQSPAPAPPPPSQSRPSSGSSGSTGARPGSRWRSWPTWRPASPTPSRCWSSRSCCGGTRSSAAGAASLTAALTAWVGGWVGGFFGGWGWCGVLLHRSLWPRPRLPPTAGDRPHR